MGSRGAFLLAEIAGSQMQCMKTSNKLGIACGTYALICIFASGVAARAQTQAATQTRTMTDEVGRRVAVPLQVRRIVTLAPNLTEIVYALGAGDRLVGVSEYSDHPPAAKTKPSIGMPVNPSLEAVVGARPDLVLATTSINFAKTVDALSHLGIAVYTTDPHSVDGTLRSISDIGEVIGESSRADALVATLRSRLNALKVQLAGTAPVNALFVVWEDPLISIGDNTFIADALRWAGVQSVIHTKQNWPQISMEEVVKVNPDYIVYADNQMGEYGNDSSTPADLRTAISRHLAELRREPAWRNLAAVREGHIAVVDEEIEVPAPGLIDTIELLAHELHPNLFTKRSNPQSSSGASPAFSTVQEIPQEAALCAR
jgi:iron complex transport system substrate-binding protein